MIVFLQSASPLVFQGFRRLLGNIYAICWQLSCLHKAGIFLLQQFIVGYNFLYPAVIDHDNLVSISNRGKPVGYNNGGASPIYLPLRPVSRFRLRMMFAVASSSTNTEGLNATALAKDINCLWPAENDAPSFFHFFIVLAWQGFDEFICTNKFCGGYNIIIGNRLVFKAYI